jgi:hypothetical protein
MARSGINKVGIKHEALLQYMLAYPSARVQDVAAEFQLSLAWTSCIIHSDAFQEQLKARQDELFASIVVTPLKDKVEATAHMAVEKLAEKIPTTEDPAILAGAADKLLGRLGFGASGNTFVQQNNSFNGNGAAVLSRARDLALAASQNHQIKEVDSASEAERLGLIEANPPAALPVTIRPGSKETDGGEIRAESTPPTGEKV